jgi:hypothetical protein
MTEPNQRRFARRGDIFVVAGLVAVALIAMVVIYLMGAPSGNIAVVTVEGREIMRIDLGDYTNKEDYITLREDYGVPVDFEIRDATIRFVNVDCPDHLCEAMGAIGREYDSAICMPNQTVVAIYSPDDAPYKVGG